jgi:hypothetical protein
MRREWKRLTADARHAIWLLLIMGVATTGLMLYRGDWVFAGLMVCAFAVATIMTYVEDSDRRL